MAKIIVFALYAAVLTFSGAAHAKRGMVVFNTGDELFEVAPYQIVPQSPPITIGYKCSHFGLFWADVFTWDCKMVAYLGETTYADLPDQLATQLQGDPRYKMSKAKRGFWNHYAFWVLIGLVCLIGVWMFRQQAKVDAESEKNDKIEAFKLRQQMRAQESAPGAETSG
jgi:hypothetical protein